MKKVLLILLAGVAVGLLVAPQKGSKTLEKNRGWSGRHKG